MEEEYVPCSSIRALFFKEALKVITFYGYKKELGLQNSTFTLKMNLF